MEVQPNTTTDDVAATPSSSASSSSSPAPSSAAAVVDSSSMDIDVKPDIVAATLIEPQKPKAPLSGYFLFLGKYRPKVKAENPGATIGEIGKILGKQWSTLAEEEKTTFTSTAAEAKAKYQEKIIAWKLDMEDFISNGGIPSSHSTESQGDPRDNVLPLARIKKIMKRDPDVSNMSKEALFLMTKCTDLFVEHLGEQSIRQAYGQKRKSVRVEDITSAIRSTSSARFLEADFPITGPTNHKRQKTAINNEVSPQSVAGPMDQFFSKKTQKNVLPEVKAAAAVPPPSQAVSATEGTGE